MSEENNQPDAFYDPFSNMTFSYDNCFLCGSPFSDDKTVEHVFPKWLQHKFDLWNQRITLLNQTELPYKLLTIPCCKTCNNELLSDLEKEIQEAFDSGYSEFKKLDPLRLFQWIGKIYYGILFKELSLNIDRSDPTQGKIATPELLERYQTLHMFLQSIRKPFDFQVTLPWSIFIVELLPSGEKTDFDYIDNFVTLTFSLRIGNIGIIAHLQDNGIHKEMLQKYYDQFDGVQLVPIQFNELVAKAMYNSTLMNRTPKYTSILPSEDREPVTVIPLPLQGMSSKPIFDDWVESQYAKYLSFYLRPFGISYDQLYDASSDRVMTWLRNEDGKLKRFDKDMNIIS
ncbi:hypothetical protein PV433_17080 [Paenibacillus sp. GYB004]|uniref:hypothetical protein n=1 Tax=Paenibacillus sp. GYB004 TaxID=2994393 RepID=UPI002F9632A8